MTRKNQKIELPFTIIKSEVTGGYIDSIHNDFTGGIDIVNYHEEKYGNFEQNPLQSPVTQKWVGGYPYRHVDLNSGQDDSSNRQEAWHIDFTSTGVKFYSHKKRNSPPSYWSRDMLAKSPINIKNIKTSSGSLNIGNYSHNYEVLQTSGRRITNNLIVDGFTATGELTTQFVYGANSYELPILNSVTGSKSIIVERFNSPGSKEESSRGALDREGEEISPNISLPFRNIKIRQPFYRQLAQHNPQFGSGSTYALLPETGIVDAVTIHKVNRNRLPGTGSINDSYDNGFVTHIIPRTDIQYSWITSSSPTTSQELRGYQYRAYVGAEEVHVGINFLTGSEVLIVNNRVFMDNIGISSIIKDSKKIDLEDALYSIPASNTVSYSEYANSRYGFGVGTSINKSYHPITKKLIKNNIFPIMKEPIPQQVSVGDALVEVIAKRGNGNTNFYEPPVTFKYRPLVHKVKLAGTQQNNRGYKIQHTYSNNLSTFANKSLINRLYLEDTEKPQFYNIIMKLKDEENSQIQSILNYSYKETIWPREQNTSLSRIRTRETYYLDKPGFGLDGFDRQLGTQRVFWRDLQEDRRRSETTDGGYYSSFNYLSTEETGSNFVDNKQGPLIDNKFVSVSGSLLRHADLSLGLYNSISILENLNTKKEIFNFEGKISSNTISPFDGYDNELPVTRVYNNIFKKCWNLSNSGEFNSTYIDFYESSYAEADLFIKSLGSIYRNTNYKKLLTNLPKEESQYNDLFARTEDDELSLNPKVKYLAFIGGVEMNTGSISQDPDKFSSAQDFIFSTNGTVYAINKKDNFLYVGGEFTKAGPITAKNIARINLLTGLWQSLPIGGQTEEDNGTDGVIRAIEISGSDIYVGGNFENCSILGNQNIRANNIARFNIEEQAWYSLSEGGISAVDNGVGNTNSLVFDLQLSGSDLYVGGDFTNAYNGTNVIDSEYLARFNTTTKQWDSSISATSNVQLLGPATCFKLAGNDLYIGGDFKYTMDPINPGQQIVHNITKFDTTADTFSKLGSGITNNLTDGGYVTDIDISGNYLYAVGNITREAGSTNVLGLNILKYNISANSWESVGNIINPVNDGLGGYIPETIFENQLCCLSIVGDKMYIGFSAGLRWVEDNRTVIENGPFFLDLITEEAEKMQEGSLIAGTDGQTYAFFNHDDSLYIAGNHTRAYNRNSTIDNRSIVEWSIVNKEFVDTTNNFKIIDNDYFAQTFDKNEVAFSTIDNGLLRNIQVESGQNQWSDTYQDYVEELKRAGKEYSLIPEFNISNQMDYYDSNQKGNFRIGNSNFLKIDGISEKITALSASTSDMLKKQTILQSENSDDMELEKITIKIDGIKKLMPYNGFYPQERTIQLANLYNDYIDRRLGGGTYNLNYYNDFFSDFVSQDVMTGSATNITVAKLGEKHILIKNILSTIGGEGQEVTDFVEVDNKLYVVGSFFTAGNRYANNIAVYDLGKKTWDTVPSGGGVTQQDNGVLAANTGTVIRKIIHNNGNLYIGGRFDIVNSKDGTKSANNVVKFNIASQEWIRLPDDDSNGIVTQNNSNDDGVYSLAFYNSSLYVGGRFQEANRSSGAIRADNIVRFSNTWYPIPSGGSVIYRNGVGHSSYSGEVVVKDLHVSGTDIYVGGYFNRISNSTATNYATMTPVNNIAVISSNNWNTTKTTSINTGYSGDIIYDIENSGSDIYVVGQGINKWDGANWDDFGVNLQSNQNAKKILFSGSDFYVAGDFQTINLGGTNYYVNGITKWNDSESNFNTIPSSSLPTVSNNNVGFQYSSCTTLFLSGSKLYVGGSFKDAGQDYDSDFITTHDTLNSSSWFSWDNSRLGLYTSSANDPTQFSLVQNSDLYSLTGNKSKLLNVAGKLYHFTSRQNFETGNDGYILYNESTDALTWTELSKLRISNTANYISGSGTGSFAHDFDAIYDSLNKKVILAFSVPNESDPDPSNGNVYIVTGSVRAYDARTITVSWGEKRKIIQGSSYDKMGLSVSILSCSSGYQVYAETEYSQGGKIWVTTSTDAETWTSPIYIAEKIRPIKPAVCSFKDKSYLFFASGSSDSGVYLITSSVNNDWGTISEIKNNIKINTPVSEFDHNPDSISVAVEKTAEGEDARLHYSFTNSKNGLFGNYFQYSEIFNGSSLDGETFETEDDLLVVTKKGDFGGLSSAYSSQISEDGREIPILFTDFEDADAEYKIYSLKQEKSILYSLKVSGSEQKKAFKHAAIEPFFAPGILYNTIKSGIAVDWPCATGSDNAIVPYGNNTIVNAYYPQPIKMHEYQGENIIQTSYGLLKSRIDYRIPFEYILNPAAAFEEKQPIQEDIISSKLSSLLPENDPVATNLKGAYVYGGYEPYISPYDFSDINNLSPKRFSVPFVYSKSSTTGGQLFTMAMSNFLAESVNFFLQDGRMTVFKSKPDNEWLQFDDSKTYYMDVIIEKDSDLTMMEAWHSDKHPTGPNGEKMNGRYFGYPVNKTTKELWAGSEFSSDEAKLIHNDPAYAPYTPPYFEGTAKARISFKPDSSRLYSLQEVLQKIKVENIFPGVSLGAAAGSDALLNKMSVSSSMNIRGSDNPTIVQIDGTTQAQTIIDNPDAQSWVFTPRMETPVLDFSDSANISYEEDYVKHGGFGRGMWSNYGKLSENSIKIKVKYPYSSINSPFTASLLDQIGLESQEQEIGQIAPTKEISEAVVLIPYLENEQQGLTTISRDSNKFNFIKITQQKYDEQKTELEKLSSNQPQNSIQDMIKKAKNYVIPPNMNFLEYDDIQPFVMYIVEFKHILEKQELADIWQGVLPESGRKMEPHSVAFTHNAGINEFFEGKPLPNNLKWLIFKVKKKGEKDYYKKREDLVGDERFSFQKLVGKETAPRYSYNWPYDFFSLVEYAKIELNLDYKKKEQDS